MSAISSIKSLEENHGVYRGKDCMKKFCEYPRECSMEFINFKTKKEVVNKRAAGIIWKCKTLLYF